MVIGTTRVSGNHRSIGGNTTHIKECTSEYIRSERLDTKLLNTDVLNCKVMNTRSTMLQCSWADLSTGALTCSSLHLNNGTSIRCEDALNSTDNMNLYLSQYTNDPSETKRISDSIGIGKGTLKASNSHGSHNIAVGFEAGNITTGNGNISIGKFAGKVTQGDGNVLYW